MVYRFIQCNSELFGLRWLLKRLSIYPNSYYHYIHRHNVNHDYEEAYVYNQIYDKYYELGGVYGHRSMVRFLSDKGIKKSKTTVHKYMNKELGLKAIVRPKKLNYRHGEANKVFPNLLQQDFKADTINQKWCTDFTYLFLTNGDVRYNCSIIDLHDRSIVASVCGREIDTQLAISAVRKALESQPAIKGQLILHSDQGVQFTSKEFTEFCNSVHITQSMSRAGYPYDNAPMERYFNTLKNELIYQHYYHTEEELYKSIERFAYVWYNYGRPHSYNGYMTPIEARYKAA
jgi:putative transposase